MKVLFGKRLQELRREKGLTQETLSEMINISPENYSRIESGLSFPKPQNIVKIADALNVEISELFRFSRPDNIEQIKEKLFNIIKSDDDTAKIVYSFLLNAGKI